jgi:tyrosinase
MARVRKDVWSLGAGWNDTVLWYAKAVRDLSSKPIVALAGWRFLAAMHGIDEELWAAFGYLASGETKPAQSVQKKFWNQCQHQTWYFLPWHRGYVAAFENIVRASIVAQGGPGDWALPYWNYNSPAAHANRLPWALEQKKLPDGADNPLFVQRRYGDGTGLVVLDRTRISPAQALADPDFAGPSSANPGFGGPQTKWHHGGEDQAPSGHLEQSPHNIVHSLIGGVKRGANPSVAKNVGLMAMPDTAALDPIFWLHHANIDRLWEVWLHRPTSTGNPTVATWLKGPPKRFHREGSTRSPQRMF